MVCIGNAIAALVVAFFAAYSFTAIFEQEYKLKLGQSVILYFILYIVLFLTFYCVFTFF